MQGNRARLAEIIRRCLEEGATVEIEGLGVFHPGPHGYGFRPTTLPRVFVAYVQEDLAAAGRLYEQLRKCGYDAWLDKRKLLPGQNWPRAIESAIEVSDFFIACLSRRAVSKKGQFQSELRYALDCTRRIPLDEVFFIPVRLEECPVPSRIRREIQYVDLFPDWEKGFRRVLEVMEEQRRKRAAVLPLAG